MKTSRIILLSLLGLGALYQFSACKDDPPKPQGNEQEVITTFTLHLQDSATLDTFSYTWRDLDGPGGNPPAFDTLLLDSGKVYYNVTYLLNESVNPPDSISKQVKVEGTQHQFFYTPSASLGSILQTYRLDKDLNNNLLGLESRFVVTGRGAGSLNVKLSHYDGIPKTDAPAPESDLDIDIPVRLK